MIHKTQLEVRLSLVTIVRNHKINLNGAKEIPTKMVWFQPFKHLMRLDVLCSATTTVILSLGCMPSGKFRQCIITDHTDWQA